MHVATKKAPLRRGFLLRVDHQIGRPIRGLSLGRYLAPRRRVSISMTMKPAATIAAFKFNVSAKSAAALRNSRKVVITTPIVAGALVITGTARRQLSKRVTLGSGNYSENESAWGPNAEHRSALNAEVASPASRSRTWGRTRMRLKEPAPPGYFCARMRRPLRFRNRTPFATSLRSLRGAPPGNRTIM